MTLIQPMNMNQPLIQAKIYSFIGMIKYEKLILLQSIVRGILQPLAKSGCMDLQRKEYLLKFEENVKNGENNIQP